MGSRRVGHDWASSLSHFTFMRWRRKWQPTPVFLPGESQGRGAWWAAIYGVAQSRTRLKRLSSSSSNKLRETSKACLLRFSPSTFKLEIRMLLCSGCRKDTSRRRVLWSVLGEGRGKVRVTFLPVLFIQLKIFNTRRAIQHKIFIHQGPHWGSYVLNPFTPNSAPFLWCKT